MGTGFRTVALVLVAVVSLALSACTTADGMAPAATRTASAARTAPTDPTAPPSVPEFPLAPTPAHAAGPASLRAAFGTGCASTRPSIPAPEYRATIDDVDGDGRDDTEWVTTPRAGYIEFGVTTAAGVTIAKTVGFASGGERSVSIGTLSSGQTVALPTDLHTAPLFVLHDCRWLEPKVASGPPGSDFFTAYSGSGSGAGAGCVGRRLYQIFSTRSSNDHETVTGVTEHISPNGRTVEAAGRVTFLADADADTSLNTIQRYGDGNCMPSQRLVPVHHRS